MDASDLRYAAGRNQIGLALAPLADARTGAVAGFVARAVWDHPTAGRIGPERVRRLASGLDVAWELDAWAAELACEAVAGWGREALDALALLAVDVAPTSAADPAVRRGAQMAAEIAGLPPDRLRLVADAGDLAAALAAFGLAPVAPVALDADAARAQLTGRTRPDGRGRHNPLALSRRPAPSGRRVQDIGR